MPPRGFLDMQIDRQAKHGVGERAAHQFVMAMHKGGYSTPEALAVMRDRFCAHLGSGHELLDVDRIPQDRCFRDAWRRSHNGGPISIDIGRARRVQFARIKDAALAEERRRAADIELFDRPVELPWGALRDRIHAASDVDELRRVWPEELRP